jgi:hypothetical protein
MVQVVEYLHSKCEAPSLNTSTAKKKKKNHTKQKGKKVGTMTQAVEFLPSMHNMNPVLGSIPRTGKKKERKI